MTDTWYVFGGMVADPDFFPVIGAVKDLKFPLIDMRVSENGGQAAQRRAAGFLDDVPTTTLRRQFRDYANAHLAQPMPVISLFTAGKCCQLFFTLDTFEKV